MKVDKKSISRFEHNKETKLNKSVRKVFSFQGNMNKCTIFEFYIRVFCLFCSLAMFLEFIKYKKHSKFISYVTTMLHILKYTVRVIS